MNSEHSDKKFPTQDPLDLQVERGNLFTHSALTQYAARINESESFLFGLIDLMVKKGMLTADEVSQAVSQNRAEMKEKKEALHPGIAMRVDRKAKGEFIPVNCEERMHICNAICCKLDFALSAEEVESGKVKWDLGRPYFIRHESHGHCTHIDPETKKCGIYHDRPSVCKIYSCAKDERIWKDFDKMELNHEWINNHKRESKFKLTGATMMQDQEIVHPDEAGPAS